MKAPILAISIAIWCNCSAVTSSGAELSEEDRKRASELYKEFAALKDRLADRGPVIDKMLELGSPVGKVIYPIIDREWRAASERYRSGFLNQTKTLASSKNSREQRERIKTLRTQVQSLQHIKDLKKETIIKIGDPALEELRKLTKITRVEILASSPALAEARAGVVLLGQQRNACIESLLLVEVEKSDLDSLTNFENKIAAEALTTDRDVRKTLERNGKLASEIEPAEAEGIRDLNELRILIGLYPVVIDPLLCAAGRDHSKDMKEKGFFAHESPVPNKKTPWDRAKLHQTSASSENIFAGAKSGAAANRGWWHSPGHHKNMLSPGARRVGLGNYGEFWTQMFGG